MGIEVVSLRLFQAIEDVGLEEMIKEIGNMKIIDDVGIKDVIDAGVSRMSSIPLVSLP